MTAPTETPLNPYVFFVGCPRSGTTLLKRLADAHRDLAVTPETHWISRLYRRGIGVDDSGRTTPELLAALREDSHFGNLKIGLEEIEAMIADQPPYADFVSRLFDRYGEKYGKTLVGDKTPSYVKAIDLFHDLWPRVRFVLLVRDGRDVCLSLLSWSRAARNVGRLPTWQEDPVSTAAWWWKRQTRRGLEACARLPPNLRHHLRYEEMIADPGRECERLCSFLALPFDSSMLQFYEGKQRDDPGLSAKKAWLPVTSGLRDWRSQMPADAIERFEAIAGDLLEELGYRRACPHPSVEAITHASRIAEACSAVRGKRGAPQRSHSEAEP
jgi:hypothetical protein